MAVEERKILTFNKIDHANITVENHVLELLSHNDSIKALNINQFLLVDPQVIKHEYYYPSGLLKIIPKQPFEIVKFSDHVEIRLAPKDQPFREPCDWWFHSGPTTDKHGNQIPKGPFYCANKKSDQFMRTFCPRQTCDDYAIIRDDRK